MTEPPIEMRKLLLFAGFASALGALGAGHLYLSRLESEVSGGPKVSILIATQDVPAGTQLTEQQLAIRDLPEAYLDSRSIRASESKRAIGHRLSTGLKSQQMLLWSDLATYSDQGRMLAGLVSSGLRAVEIDSKVSSFDGLLRPGDRIDLLLTVEPTAGATKSTLTLIQNLLVLAIGGSMDSQEPAGSANLRASRYGGVTVSATLAQAQLITQAKTRGLLTLVLRNPDDVKVIEGIPETTDSQIADIRSGLSLAGRPEVSKTGEPK